MYHISPVPGRFYAFLPAASLLLAICLLVAGTQALVLPMDDAGLARGTDAVVPGHSAGAESRWSPDHDETVGGLTQVGAGVPALAPETRSRFALVDGPTIASVSPPIASAGTNTTITIEGTGFGAKASRESPADVGFPADGGVYWASGRTSTSNPDDIVSWSDTAIVVRVPSGFDADGIRKTASSGGLRVVTDAGAGSEPFPFAVSFGVAGKRWARPPVFAVNDNCPGVAGGAGAVRRAVATWNTALPDTYRIDCSGRSNGTAAARDGVSLIAWGPSGGITYYYENDTIVEADIILSTSYAWTAGEAGGSVYGIEPVTLRNLGFCIGIAWLAGAEPQGPSDTGKVSYLSRRDGAANMNLVHLSPADRAAADYLYGGGIANPPLLAAAFTADTIAGPAPLTVRFTDVSLGGATGRTWDFGDGGTAAEPNPVHVYTAPGAYTVTLTASASGYPDDTVRAVERIAVTGVAVRAVPGGAGVPTSTANDDRCDDVDGNGVQDFADVVLYFNQMDWIAANEPAGPFDYNSDSRIDFADVVWLFNTL
jgi:PKD repeat protein